MKLTNIAILLFATVTIACGVDVTDPQAGYFDDHQDKSGTQNFNNMGSGTMEVNINYNNGSATTTSVSNDINTETTLPNTSYKSYFMTDLEYVGIFKHSNGAYLVMKNNTKYYMSVSVNFSISCKVNNKNEDRVTKTLTFPMKMYEQKESTSSIDGYWHGGLDTIECSGTIISIIPSSYDESNFQPWTGNFDIKTN